ncbi:MAG: XRE family transcriptional regulator [Betaproteobacteria bacterium]|nr:MAG: XRE family transcriptional regulator [Betaproteobacteria bacterium]
MEISKTVAEWESDLGSQVRALRLRANLDQVSLAERAGIGLTALKNLESGKGATVKTLVRMLRALNRAEWLLTLAPSVSISPLQMLKAKSMRQRASPKNTRQGNGDEHGH